MDEFGRTSQITQDDSEGFEQPLNNLSLASDLRTSDSPRQKDFSAYNREMCQQSCPDTQERVQLLTEKQLRELLRKQLKEF